jgi:hypothetical protein
MMGVSMASTEWFKLDAQDQCTGRRSQVRALLSSVHVQPIDVADCPAQVNEPSRTADPSASIDSSSACVVLLPVPLCNGPCVQARLLHAPRAGRSRMLRLTCALTDRMPPD